MTRTQLIANLIVIGLAPLFAYWFFQMGMAWMDEGFGLNPLIAFPLGTLMLVCLIPTVNAFFQQDEEQDTISASTLDAMPLSSRQRIGL
jgi:hypothetical protein